MFGRILSVDLGSGQIQTSQAPQTYLDEYIGGSGLGARLLWDDLDPTRPALDPDSPLLWVNGPLTGSAGPSTGRSAVCARSPQTGLWGEANIGGFVGAELGYAGFDILRIHGRAVEPVYLWIHDGEAEIRPASHLWGKADIYETQAILRAELDQPQAKIACIGLGGENQVIYAGILSDHGRAAGRTGMGAVMGSKNLKAIAVRGTKKLPLARPEDYRKQRVQANKDLLEQNMTAVFRATGTSGASEYFQMLGDMPQKYWTAATFENAGSISGSTMAETILTRPRACQGCVIACGREIHVKEGPYATPHESKGPEYETICAFGSQLLVDDLALVSALGNHCDRLGLDVISAGNTIALAYYLFDNGLLTSQDTGGLELRWGDARPCFTLLDQIAARSGLGALLAQGSRALAAHYGVESWAVQVNNLEVPMHDPRAATGMALAYVTSPRGACHNQSDFFMVETGGSIDELDIPMGDRLGSDGKAVYVARHQDFRTVCNSLVMCFFAVVPPTTMVSLLSAASGRDWTLTEMMRAGERAWNLKRLLNYRLGLTRAQEKLPELLLRSLPDGGHSGATPDMDVLLREYYAARGWDLATGLPDASKLRELALENIPVPM